MIDKMNIRKLAAVFAAIAISTCAQAQLYIGGHIGLTSGPNGTGLGVNIAPEVGYRVSNMFTVGGLVSYQSSISAFGVTPYGRLNAVTLGDRLRLFLEARVPFRFANDYQSYGFDIHPGIVFRIADRMSLMAHIGTFGYVYSRSSTQVLSNGWVARLDGNSITLGFCFDI